MFPLRSPPPGSTGVARAAQPLPRRRLRVADVDFMRGIVYPRVQYPAEQLKTEISRTPVPVPQSLALELAAHVERWPSHPAAGRS